ncbi:MAG: putative colanic acid biosynthesis acetyltransferase [Devosia sp.]
MLDAKQTVPMRGGPSFSFRHRAQRAVWSLVWVALGRWTPTPLHGWRRMLLRVFGARLAATAKVYPGVDIWLPANLEMAEYATLGRGVVCYAMARISLGPYALVSQRASLCAGTHDVDDPSFQLIVKPISIGERAWVAAEAFVGPGVTLGEGAVLGARAVTFRDLEPWTIYAGNPAKPIRRRNRAESPQSSIGSHQP